MVEASFLAKPIVIGMVPIILYVKTWYWSSYNIDWGSLVSSLHCFVNCLLSLLCILLGFLSLNDKECNVPGNAGLKDQIMALQWIQNNCSTFGGNPHNVTVCGQSAGGASIDYLLFNDRVKGLFHRAIQMSGNSFCSWALTQCQHRAYRLAQLAGYKGDANDANVLAYLSKAKAYHLIKLDDSVLTEEEHAQKVMFAFGPTIEPYATSNCVIPKSPREMLLKAWGNSIPLMLGFTSFEGLFMLSGK